MYERLIFRSFGLGVCGLILGLSLGYFGQVLAQEALISNDKVISPISDVLPEAYKASLNLSKKVDSLIASTSLDIVSATEIIKLREASKPQNDALLEKLEQIVTLLEAILRRI